MRDAIFRAGARQGGGVVLALAMLLFVGGCNLDKQTDPNLSGPSDQGVNVDLVALPDTLNADGVSQSIVRLVLRDNTGRPISGLAVLFEFNGDGVLSPSADSTFVGPIQNGIVMATDSDGTARVVYVAGTGIGSVTVFVRPYGIDAANLFYRSVEIWQR
jgi:Invasin, domain 3